ncbi:hypothetical protein HY408_02115 [Candidatus Gottesmanbacteria bacterium]|nr:hypothetical protein [Candidatus Gottesmanbacteria bacterium]
MLVEHERSKAVAIETARQAIDAYRFPQVYANNLLLEVSDRPPDILLLTASDWKFSAERVAQVGDLDPGSEKSVPFYLAVICRMRELHPELEEELTVLLPLSEELRLLADAESTLGLKTMEEILPYVEPGKVLTDRLKDRILECHSHMEQAGQLRDIRIMLLQFNL